MHCERCGRPVACPHCSEPDDLILSRLDPAIVKDVEKLMGELSLLSAQDQSAFVSNLVAYKPDQVRRAIRTWEANGYAAQNYGEAYFLAILRRLCVRKAPYLEPLPDIYDPRLHPNESGDGA